jgi:hypothetical protein
MNLNNAAAFQARGGSALINSEWGATSDPQVAERQTGEFDDNMLGDVFWDYRNLIPDVKAQPGGKNEDKALLSALERPYPTVVAGTPSGWQWDSASDTFTLHYSTQLPDGRSGAGLEGEIYVPLLHYPSGYSVSVTGASVASSTASVLRLRNEPRSKAVNVTVTPPTAASSTIRPSAPAPPGRRCVAARVIKFALHLHARERIVRFVVRIDGRRRQVERLIRGPRRGSILRLDLARLKPGRHTVAVTVVLRRGRQLAHVLLVRRYELC